MKSIVCALSALVLAGGFAGAQQSRPSSVRTELLLDGVACGLVSRWEGGDPRAQISVEPAGPDRVAKKHLEGIVYTPIVVEVPVPPAKPVVDWMNEMLSGAPTRKTVTLNQADQDNRGVDSLEGVQCILTKIALPIVDGTLRDAGHIILTLQPESTRTVGGNRLSSPFGAGTKSGIQNQFSFALDGINTTRVQRVEGLTATLKLPAGGVVQGQPVTGVPEISNLAVTFPETYAAEWKDWFRQFAIQGQNDEGREKSGTLAYLSGTQPQQELFKIGVKNVGIFSLSNEPAPTGTQAGGQAVRRVKAELYVEKVELTLPTAAGGSSGAAPPPSNQNQTAGGNPPSNPNTTPNPSPPPAPNPPSKNDPPASPNPAPNPNTPPHPGSASAPVTSSDDQGARDPADFPRPAGTVRKSFNASRNKILVSESASYSARIPLAELAAILEKTLKALGWDETGRNESGDVKKGTYSIALIFKLGSRTAQITLTQAKDGTTEYTVVVNEPADVPRAPRPSFETVPPPPDAGAKPAPAAPLNPRERLADPKLNLKPGAAPSAGVAATAPVGTAKMTGFDPKKHGFRFVNDFVNTPFQPPIKVVTSGMCGGMSYTALDYYLAGVEIPKQDYRPSHSTPLQTYIYRRQETSLLMNVDNWANYEFNPSGVRTLEIFNWGLRERLAELKASIDQGMPIQVGLKGTTAGFGHDHQVLAVGYDMGRYKGDVGDYKEELQIFLYEPNHPGEVVTMMADQAKMEFYYKEHPEKRWRSYFTDVKYAKQAPPAVRNPTDPNAARDGLIHALKIKFVTGEGELRGGALHVDLKIQFHDGTKQEYTNISEGGRWPARYVETVEVILRTPRKYEDIRFIELNTNSTKGVLGDRWDLERLQIDTIGGGFFTEAAFKQPAAWKFQGLPLQVMPK